MTSVLEPEKAPVDPVTATDPLAAAQAVARPPREPGLAGRLRAVTQGAPVLPMSLLFLLSLVEEVDRVAFGVLAPEIKASFGLTDGQYLTLVGVASALVIFAALPIGYLADRRGRVRLAWLAGVLWPLFTIATAVAGLFGLVALLVAARIAHGVGKLVNEPVHPSLIADLYAPSAVPAVSGVVRSAIVLAALFGPLAGLLGSVVGWQLALTLLCLPSIPLALRLRRLPEPPRTDTDGSPALSLRASFGQLRQVATLRRFWLSAVLYGAGTVQLQTLPSLFFAEEYGVGPTARGFLSLVSSVAGLAGLYASAVLSRRAVEQGRPARLAVIAGGSTVVLGLGFALVGVLPFLGSLSALLLIGAGGLAVFPAFQALIAAVTPLHLRSQAFASVIVCVGIGAILVAPATGVLADAYGYRPAFVVLGLVVGVGGLVQASSARTASADLRRVGQLDEPDDPSGDQLVRMRGVDAGYDGVQVLFDVDLEVRRGEVLALLGTNGAGKSTLLRVLSGLLPPTAGTVRLDGRDITSLDPVSRVKLGIVQMPGGKGVFPTLTVDEHLQLAGWLFADDKARLAEAVEEVLTRFPRLRERQQQLAGNLSGGEQQQLALGMALISRPVLLCIDELSLGLAPAVVETLLQTVREVNASGTTVVVVEQSLNVALSLADRAYFLEKGSVRFSGPTAELLERDDIVRSVFLAGAQASAAPEQEDGEDLPVRARDGLDPAAPVLEVSGVRKSFGGVRAVRGVTLQVAPGEIVGLVGGNGAGKTTLFDLVSGFLVPDEGRISFRGQDVTGWAPERRAMAGLGRSFQDARIFGSLTVAENIAVALERHLEVRDPLASTLALPAAQRVERDIAWTVDDLVALLGLEPYRDTFAGELSTGTRRVVDLAMSLAHDPDLLLLDEPSAGIAQRETEALGPLLRRVRAETGCALVVIEHDMPLLAGLCDRLVALELGAVLAEGRPDDVLADPAVVAGYLGGDPAAISRSGNRKAAP